jgi:hypothetical protein
MKTDMEAQMGDVRQVDQQPVVLRPLQIMARYRTSVLLSVLAVTVAVLVIADVQSMFRSVPTFLFLMIAPGLSLLGICGLSRGWLGVALVVATSTSLATLVAMAQLYLGIWSPSGTVVVLALVTVAGQAVAVRGRRRADSAASSPANQRYGTGP